MSSSRLYVSELSSSEHNFLNYHFCRGNNSKNKTRLGIIKKGNGTYIYLNKKLNVNEGDVVFIPENIYCYSEWIGDPEIEVMYVNCFLHYEGFCYEPQLIFCDEKTKKTLIRINELLFLGDIEELEAYSLFYTILQKILPNMKKSNISTDKILRNAMAYITDNWKNNFSVSDVAKECCVSESTIYHLFRKELGQTPITFLNSIKINHAINYLENSKYSIATISRLVCFNSENHFRKVFADVTGMTPLKFRKRS